MVRISFRGVETMVSYAVYGFVLGFIIPYIARRFAKFSPASPAESIWRLLVPVKQVNWKKKFNAVTYKRLYAGYVWRSFMCGLLTACLFVAAVVCFDPRGTVAMLSFFWALMLLAEVDYRTYLLPDVITVPLLIGGFVAASFYGSPAESALGATVGYLLPVIAGLLIVWRHPDAFGGGDVKLLAAIGAWLGVLPVICTILLASVFFALFALFAKRRAGAFGPAISFAAIIVAFYFF